MGMFVLMWFRKNVKVIQLEKDALLLKFKTITKPKEPLPPSQTLNLKTNSLSHLETHSLLSLNDQRSFVFCVLVSQASVILFIRRMPYLLLFPLTYSSPPFPYHLFSCAGNFTLKLMAKKLPALMACHKPRRGHFPFLN